ncbi:hypothetical protein [Roseivirga spongicola]|uniref:hypothetical protein n=1 Tax=Roseivirga spongicola TaxID=333140 RepID=UPI000A5B1238|nr:hypothetical protein [Roseivirga spongicola]WPZ09494.1 hypothetical protein T7867_14615 [Roseivirga spongicola]
MKKLRIILSLIILTFVSSASVVSQTSCELSVNPKNNGACNPSYLLDEENWEWVLVGTYCELYRTNAYGLHDCHIPETLPPNA